MIRAFMMETATIMVVGVVGEELYAASSNKALGGVKIDDWRLSQRSKWSHGVRFASRFYGLMATRPYCKTMGGARTKPHRLQILISSCPLAHQTWHRYKPHPDDGKEKHVKPKS